MAEEPLRVAILGDSMVWGQGLREQEKFAFKAAAQIPQHLKRPLAIDRNLFTARSGAESRATRADREDFVDTYPHLFPSSGSRTAFVDGNEEAAHGLFGELPATFPTIMHQIARVDQAAGQDVDLVILDGGINDIDFRDVLDPTGDFFKKIVPQIEGIFHTRCKELVKLARAKFPNAVIVFAGYPSLFSERSSRDAIQDLFFHLRGINETVGLILNGIWGALHALTFGLVPPNEDIPKLIRHTINQSRLTQGRALFWLTRMVGELYEEGRDVGPGIVLVSPGYGEENALFADGTPFHWEEYETDKVKDPLKAERERQCPRFEHRDRMFDALGFLLRIPLQGATPTQIRNVANDLLDQLDGPLSLRAGLEALIVDPENRSLQHAVVRGLAGDLNRIHVARIASFIHPNPAGAERYTRQIVGRFERFHRLSLRTELSRMGRPQSLRETMERYHFRPEIGAKAFLQYATVDSIAVEIRTSADSDEDMYDDVFVNFGNGRRYRLNFRHPFIATNPPARVSLQKKFEPYFEPRRDDFITLDSGGSLHLGDIRQFVLERRADEDIARFGQSTSHEIGERDWKIESIRLRLNSVLVFESQTRRTIKRGDDVRLTYPS